MRPTTSEPPPAGNGTISRTGLLGKLCPTACGLTPSARQSTPKNRSSEYLVIGSLSQASLPPATELCDANEKAAKRFHT
jgi:hypothetical protein